MEGLERLDLPSPVPVDFPIVAVRVKSPNVAPGQLLFHVPSLAPSPVNAPYRTQMTDNWANGKASQRLTRSRHPKENPFSVPRVAKLVLWHSAEGRAQIYCEGWAMQWLAVCPKWVAKACASGPKKAQIETARADGKKRKWKKTRQPSKWGWVCEQEKK